jgi:putative DNA primase/helicase
MIEDKVIQREGLPPPLPEDAHAAVARLAKLPRLDYEQAREAEAAALGIRVSALDDAVKAASKPSTTDNGLFPEVEPYPGEVIGEELLNDILHTLRRFIVCEPETAIAATLWAVMTWFIDEIQVCPLAVITAPEKRCGKTQLLDLIGRLSCRALAASSISPAATYRVIEAHRPTLMLDEADAWMKENEELRGVINSGHTRQSAYVIRSVGDDHTPTRFSTWGAKCISGIGVLPETLMDRCIRLELRRKLPHEAVERLRHAPPGLFEGLAAKVSRFALDHAHSVRHARPALPEALNDRAQDNAEPLLAIADIVGGRWPDMARQALLKINAKGETEPSHAAELLSDIRDAFGRTIRTRMTSDELVRELSEDGEAPWSTYNRGNPITQRQLAKKLGEFGIKSKDAKVSGRTLKAYELEKFTDAFSRYLHPATPEIIRNHATFSASHCSDSGFKVADKKQVAQPEATSATDTALKVADKSKSCATGKTSATTQPIELQGESDKSCGVADKNRVAGEIHPEGEPSPESF